jgi:hypothetical protein
MIQHRFSMPTLGMMAALALAVGCSDTPSLTGTGTEDISGSNSLAEIDLGLPYGGLAYTDEPVAFGDAALQAEAAVEDAAAVEEAEDEDQIQAADPALRDAPDVVRTYLRILWGNLEGVRSELSGVEDDPGRMVWDGKLSVDAGALAVRKTILFERPIDHLVPRDSRQVVAWRSVTLPHVDGILVCVLSRPDESGNVPGMITFETGPLTQTFTIADLADLDTTIPVDDAGNGVSFIGFTERPERCARGFLGGLWKADEDGNGGAFRGRFTNRDGRLRGYLAGRYGVNGDGERVFAGKIIGMGGEILGLLEGVWEPAADREGMGHFLGRWAGRNGEHKGVLRGRYIANPERPGGLFHGVWEELCTRAAEVDG